MQGEAFIIVNSCFCLCALLLGGKMAGVSTPSPLRLLTASLLGGFCSLGFWLFPSPLWLMAPSAQLRLCYGRGGVKKHLRMLAMAAASLALSAGTAALFIRFSPGAPWTLLLSLGTQLLLWLLIRLTPLQGENLRQLELCWKKKNLILPAMLDSGNLLRDPVTGLRVIVAPLGAAARMEPRLILWYQRQQLPEGFRLLKVRTAAGGCLMPLFRPEKCCLYADGKKTSVRVMVAVAGPDYSGFQALVPSGVLTGFAGEAPPDCAGIPL